MAGFNNSVIIGVDSKESRLKIMNAPGNNIQRASIDYLPFEERLANLGKYDEIFGLLFSGGYQRVGELAQSNIYVVLPDNLMAVDYVNVPTMKRQRMIDAVNTEYKNQYKNRDDLKMNSMVLSTNKKTTMYMLSIMSKTILDGMAKLAADNKLQIKGTTINSAAIGSAVMHMRQKVRRDSFIFVDIDADFTTLIICSSGRVQAYQSLPFGYNILSTESVNVESLLWDHDVAELAVINATELAKKKKLTIDQEEAEALAAELAEEAQAQAEAQAIKEQQYDTEEEAEAARLREEQERAAQELEDYGEEVEQAQPQVRKSVGKVFVKKAPKALPMFMQRPVPESEEGFVLENFRIIEKRILLMKRYCEYDPIIATPDYVMINMPPQYQFVIDALNADEENKTEFRTFAEGDYNEQMYSNLELAGALYAEQYNKNSMF